VVCLERGGYPSIYTRAKAVLLPIFGLEARDAPPQHEAMPPPEEGVAKARQEEAAAPRERSVPNRAASPPPLQGRPWAGHGLVPQGTLPNLN
jgi:hypothetical protein